MSHAEIDVTREIFTSALKKQKKQIVYSLNGLINSAWGGNTTLLDDDIARLRNEVEAFATLLTMNRDVRYRGAKLAVIFEDKEAANEVKP